MPIVYIHGVRVRSEKHTADVGKSIFRWLAPDGADDEFYVPVYWGDLCANQFRWNLDSRPRTVLLGHGAEASDRVAIAQSAPNALLLAALSSIEEHGNFIGADDTSTISEFLASVPGQDRADLLSDLYALACRTQNESIEQTYGAFAVAAARVAEKWDHIVSGAVGDDEQVEALLGAMEHELSDDPLVAHGGRSFSKVGEILRRALTAPGDIVSTVVSEGRPAANEFVATFLGDVLTYLHTRGQSTPGAIANRVLEGLRQAHSRAKAKGERLVVLTHSMGGQLFYDAITHFCDRDPILNDLRVAHWISFGSQVSFFAELGLFLGQADIRAPQKLEKPRRIEKWTNFYDSNDPVGFRMGPVFKGVEDRGYDTGYGLALAHTGYLSRPSFYEKIAAVLKD